MTHIRKLIKNLGIYTLSQLAAPLASLILAPFLTRNLSHVDYGALAVLNTAVTLLTGLTQLGLSTAFFRFYNYEYETQKDRFKVLSTTVFLLTLLSTFATIVMLIAAPWLSLLLFNSSSFSNSVRLVGVVVLLQNLTVPGFAWLRAESRAVIFAALSVANLLVCIAANFILLGILHTGISGSLIATGSGYAIVLICTLPIILLRAGFRPHIDIARGLMSFGMPSVFTFVSVWVLSLSDRFLLARLGSLAQAASYAVAYSLGGILSTIVLNPITLAWPPAMFSIAKRDDAASIFRLVFRWYGIGLLFAAFSLSFVSIIALELFFPPTYQASSPIIPVIAASYMFYGIYIFFMTGTYIRRKTWYAVVFTTTAALTNIGLNIILIPLYGPMGAAVSTLVAYVLYTLIGYVVNQRIYPIPYEIGLFVIEFLIGIVLYIGSSFLVRNEASYEVGIYIGTLVLYGASLALLGWLPTRGQRIKHAITRRLQNKSKGWKIIVLSNIWSRMSSREAPSSFAFFVKTAIVFLVGAGSGLLLPSIINKVAPLISKVGINSRSVDLIILIILVGSLTAALILILRLNELVATAVIVSSTILDAYLNLFLVSLSLALVLLLFLFLGRSARYPWVPPQALWLWALFLGLAILPTTQTIIPFDGIQYYLNDFLAAFSMFWLGTLIARDMTRVRYLFGLLAVFGAFVAIVTILQTITGSIVFNGASVQAAGSYLLVAGISRSGAFLINPNSNAGFLAMMLLIALGLLIEVPTFLIKAFYLTLAILILLALLLTYSAEGVLGAAAGVLTLTILAGRARIRIFLLSAIFGIASVVIIFLPTQVGLLLQHMSDPGELPLRSAAWQTGLRVIEAFPLAGVGLGGYVYRVRAEPYRVPTQYIVLDHPHNAYLEFGALAGLPVLIVFLALLGLFLRLALRNWTQADRRDRSLLGAGIAVVIVLSCFSLSDAGWTFPPLLVLGWLVLGVTSSPLLTKGRYSQMK